MSAVLDVSNTTRSPVLFLNPSLALVVRLKGAHANNRIAIRARRPTNEYILGSTVAILTCVDKSYRIIIDGTEDTPL
jgi:hypothetical protein